MKLGPISAATRPKAIMMRNGTTWASAHRLNTTSCYTTAPMACHAGARSRVEQFGDEPRPGADAGVAAGARLLPAIAAGERVAGDALVSPDEHVPVDAAPTEAEGRCRVVLLPFVANAAQLHPKTARGGDENCRLLEAGIRLGWVPKAR